MIRDVKISATAKQILLILVLVSFLLLFLGQYLGVTYGLSWAQAVLWELANVLFISGTVTFLLDYIKQVEHDKMQSSLDQIRNTGLVAVYSTSESADMKARIVELIAKSKDIKLMGTAITALTDLDIWNALLSKAERREARVEIYLANPYSESVNERLIHEEVRCAPIIGWGGINNRIDALLYEKSRRDIPDAFLDVRLFNHYPTVAILSFNSEILVYHYGYQELGNRSPAYCYSVRSDSLAFHYIDQLNHIRDDSFPAELLIAGTREMQHSSEWAAALPWYAIYLVPEPDSVFYRLWTDLLGYDVWQGREVAGRPEILSYRGDANTFGCHITVLDAMGVWCSSQLSLVHKQLEWLARGYRPFTMNNLGYLTKFKKNALVVGFTDSSGQVESLHAEVVTRFGSQAALSNYQIQGHPAAEALDMSSRTRHMLERYHTPFCLNEYRSHVTVLGNLQAISVDDAHQLVNSLGYQGLQTEPLRFSAICLMELGKSGFWQVSDAVKLGA